MDVTLHMLKALADRNRLRVVMAMAAHGELCVCQITELLQVATGTVSRHMSVLQNATLVENRKDARWVYYRLSSAFPNDLLMWLKASITEDQTVLEDKQRLEQILVQSADELCRVQNKRRKNRDSIKEA